MLVAAEGADQSVKLNYARGSASSSRAIYAAIRLSSVVSLIAFLNCRIPLIHGGFDPWLAFANPSISLEDSLTLCLISVIAGSALSCRTKAGLFLAVMSEAILVVSVALSALGGWPYGGAVKENAGMLLAVLIQAFAIIWCVL